jgi:predicted DNA binding protein
MACVVVTAALRFRHRGCVSEGFAQGISLVEIAGDRGFDLYVLQAPDPATLAATQAALEGYVGAPIEEIQRGPTALVFRHHNPPEGSIGTIRRSGCSIVWPAVWREGVELFTVVAEHREQLRRLLASLDAMGSVTVERMSDLQPEGLGVAVPLADLASGLTQRQLDVLQRALQLGYYDTPRRATSREVAQSFGVSPSTLKEHLRKAEAAVLHRLGALLAEHPALVRASTKGPGRPPAAR